MTQMSLLQPSTWSVTQVTHYLKDLLESDHNLADLWVQGEISNVSQPRSGHLYFTIKDSRASLKCVMWRNMVQRQRYLPRDGDAIEVHGSISVYEVGGQYQLYADLIRPLGEGALYQEFLRLKTQLESEGLFDEKRKREIPEWPRCIGIITSPTGAALRDILNTLRRRYPLVEVVLAPSTVQGEEAPADIISALRSLNQKTKPDLILLARGGGSIEDLWAFNNEAVARAIAASEAPIISGVGHETDFTIADFVADQRAPTPTAAAELATPDRDDLMTTLNDLYQRLVRTSLGQIAAQRYILKEVKSRLQSHTPTTRIMNDRQRLDELTHRTERAFVGQMQLQKSHLSGLLHRLEALNPQAILERGYAVVSSSDGKKVIRSTAQVQIGDELNIQVSDGEFPAQVKKR
jgi:exodeoxyribonuclease VII large subunit